jgi:hypothetical protein
MPRLARPVRLIRDRAAALASPASRCLISPVRRHRKALVVTGAALALAGTGSAAAATASVPPAPAARQVQLTADLRAAARRTPRLRMPGIPARSPARSSHANPAAAPAPLPLADQLMPVGTTGPQTWMPISGSQLANATTIVQQALAMQMGVRSAVIAVATAMQESGLQDVGYGTGGSLGLFQQQPADGWGTAQQIMDPTFAADAFLTALQQYEAGDPGWAAQPLWASAQGVQKSGYPLAYAQWEAQAASLVRQIAPSQSQ